MSLLFKLKDLLGLIPKRETKNFVIYYNLDTGKVLKKVKKKK